MQSTGQASTQAVSFVPMQGSAMTYVMNHLHRLSRYAFRKMNSTSPQLPKTRDPMIRFLCDSYLTRTALMPEEPNPERVHRYSRTANALPLRFGCGQTASDTVTDEFSLKLCNRGEDSEYEATVGS